MELISPEDEVNKYAFEKREKIRKEREFDLEQKGLEKEIEKKKKKLEKKEIIKNWLIILIIIFGLVIFSYFLFF